jgi:glutamine synthetase
VLARYAERGWTVHAATEMEFSLVDDSGKRLRPPRDPRSRRRLMGADILSLDELDAFDAFFTELYDGCEAMGLRVQAIMNEAGMGQFEVSLEHQEALAAADAAILFKILTRGMARKHGMAATFMAKPYDDDAGNGMHVHFSVVDDDGINVFNDGGPKGTPLLRHAVAGCVAAMPASTLIFAPHGPSYKRFAPGSHAPTGASWAYENRTAAIRIPGGSPKARRIEHRAAGGDANPYLLFAAILGAAIEGIDTAMTPPEPIIGNAYEAEAPQLHTDWKTAIDRFDSDPFIARCLPDQLIRNLVLTKRQEMHRLEGLDEKDQWKLYLERA